MDLNAIAVFVKIVETGSLSGAARLLKMPKTTVSARLAALERALGVNLVQRTTRRLNVTEAGSKYFEYCALAMRALDDGQGQLLALSDRPRGVLRITAPVDVGHTLLPRIVHVFLERYPEVSVDLLISNRLVDLVAEGVDLALRAGNMKDSSLIGRRLMDLTFNIWGAPRYLESMGAISHPRELSKFPFVTFGDGRTIEFVKGKTSVPMVLTAGRVRCDDLETVKSLLKLGNGIGWLPDFLAADDVKNGALAPVLPDWKIKGAGQVHFLYVAQKYALPKVRAFIDTALEVTASLRI